jgi:hypothetical protein
MAIKLKYQNPGVQFAVFFALTVGMILLNIILNSFAFEGVADTLLTGTPTQAKLSQFKWFQVVSTTMIFVMPALLYGILAHEKPLPYLGVKRDARVWVLLVTLLLLVAVQPFTMLVGDLNQQADFGTTIRRLEELSDKALQKFMVMNSPQDLFINSSSAACNWRRVVFQGKPSEHT